MSVFWTCLEENRSQAQVFHFCSFEACPE